MRATVIQASLMAKSAEGRFDKPVGLQVADQLLGPSPSALQRLQVRDIGVGEVGDEHLVAETIGVGEGELGPGMGFRAPGDGPGAHRPQREVDEIGDLGHLGALALRAPVGTDGGQPSGVRALPRTRFGSAR